MVKTIHLVRHGHTALLGRVLCGRMSDIRLDALGCRQILTCAESMVPTPSAIHTSPQQRTLQSAGILAWYFGLPVEIVPALDEIDFGAWSGHTFHDLDDDPCWKLWNSRRGTSRPPNGESMGSLQQRVVRYLEQLRKDTADATIVVVSHAEPIRAALLHYTDTSLDDFLSISVDPASISTLCFDRAGVRISRINQRMAA